MMKYEWVADPRIEEIKEEYHQYLIKMLGEDKAKLLLMMANKAADKLAVEIFNGHD